MINDDDDDDDLVVFEDDMEHGKDYYKELCNNLFHDDSDEDDDESTPFEKIAKKMVDICPLQDEGIMKQILKHGAGPQVTEGALVRFHYNGYQEYADEPFDSTRCAFISHLTPPGVPLFHI